MTRRLHNSERVGQPAVRVTVIPTAPTAARDADEFDRRRRAGYGAVRSRHYVTVGDRQYLDTRCLCGDWDFDHAGEDRPNGQCLRCYPKCNGFWSDAMAREYTKSVMLQLESEDHPMTLRSYLIAAFAAAFIAAAVFVGPEVAGFIRDAAGGFADLAGP